MKHTPGPWRVGHYQDYGHTIYSENPVGIIVKGGVSLSNARLIASAPDLLGALKDTTEQLGLYLSSIEDGKDDDAESAYQHGLAIIAKAEGGE